MTNSMPGSMGLRAVVGKTACGADFSAGIVLSAARTAPEKHEPGQGPFPVKQI